MISLCEYINKKINNLNESYQVIQDMIINERFNSSLLSKLAKKIYDFEDRHREEDKKRVEYYKSRQFFSAPRVDELSFSKIFGPINDEKGKVRGIKWEKISDNDFTKYNGYDAALHKIIKSVFSGKKNAIIIICDMDTQDIIFVIRGFNETPSIWTFDPGISNINRRGVSRLTKRKYSYSIRDYKAEEMIETINDYEAYVLIVTDDMIKEYNDLRVDREKQQQGIIYYDKKSLDKLAEQQRNQYKRIANKMRAAKLTQNHKNVFNEIKQLNIEVLDIYSTIMENPEFIDRHYYLGSLLDNVNRAFEKYYQFLTATNTANKFSDNEDNFYKMKRDDYINSTKEYIDKIKKDLSEIRKELSN